MRISISNIAWDVAEDREVASLLRHFNIDAIDIAPSKYFPDIQKISTTDIKKIKNWWMEQGIAIIGLQALLFGTKDLNLFADATVQSAMLQHLQRMSIIAAELGATKLVFGSPKNRNREGLSDETANTIAIDFFQRLGDIGSEQQIEFCLEPNPVCYGANFMTNSEQTAYVVTQVNHPAIKMQLDLGALHLNTEDINLVIHEYGHLIGHIHLSEPHLVTLNHENIKHTDMGNILKTAFPKHIVSIEMLKTKNTSSVADLKRALKLAIHHYGG